MVLRQVGVMVIIGGVILPPGPWSPMILAPPVNISGELHSSTAMWASELQKMAP